jgi:hypothetical protein
MSSRDSLRGSASRLLGADTTEAFDESAKAAQFQVIESNSSQGKHFKSANATLRRNMPAQPQRNAAQVGEGYVNSGEMMYMSAKPAST